MKMLIKNSWNAIAPFWPLKNLIAINPLQGYEKQTFSDALSSAESFFQRRDLPKEMHIVNRETIKWIQPFFDLGIASIPLPLRDQGLFTSIVTLLEHDTTLVHTVLLSSLPKKHDKIIAYLFETLSISEKDQELLATLMLTTLPGWASHIKYQAKEHKTILEEYLALRLLLTALWWPKAKRLLTWHTKYTSKNYTKTLKKIEKNEERYQAQLLKSLDTNIQTSNQATHAQFIFCIDVRSEQIRRSLESLKTYETFSMAGFFGLPIAIQNDDTNSIYNSCPPIVEPQHTITETNHLRSYQHFIKYIQKAYQSVKYAFAAPFALAEMTGFAHGFWMAARTLFPNSTSTIKQKTTNIKTILKINSIALEDQIVYAKNALKVMGLTKNFAPIIIFCGHESLTENNAYATALDCGACAGRSGLPNARVICKILNNKEVRDALEKEKIIIPNTTTFVPANHNTATDEIVLHHDTSSSRFKALEKDIQQINQKSYKKKKHSQDWAQPRPEWGLARNASLIIGLRSKTKSIDLDSRSFLHSYDYTQDKDGSLLETILGGPVVVAQWINCQYLFSTLDPVAFGGGSKVTANISGKIGCMQGNASDLMHGLPLQSIYESDSKPYHELARLTVVIYAPESFAKPLIKKNKKVSELIKNKWIHVIYRS